MTEIYNYLIEYDFFKNYISHTYFRYKLKQRMKYIKNKYSPNICDNELIKEYFVEIFSWSVIPQELLLEIARFLRKNEI